MFKTLSHIALSTALLLSVSGMTINMHFCEGHLYDMAFIAPAHDCCDSDVDENICHHDHDMTKSHECEDETIKFDILNDFNISTYTFDFDDIHSIDLLFPTQLLTENFVKDESPIIGILNFKKPPVTQEVVLSQIQSFLL